MKKTIISLFTVLLSITCIPLSSKASTPIVSNSSSIPTPEESKQAEKLISRLHEIKLIDKSKLNSAEKKELREEVQLTKKQLRENGGGIYLSVGAIIIIILLLIILL